MTVQLFLLTDDHIKKTIVTVPIESLKISDFNPRKSRSQEDVERLAARISRNGFEITRALWAEKNGDGYEVFAGGTRLEAAQIANLPEVPIVLHEGLTEDDKVRLADEDNENDEYHEKVNLADVWANYAWLSEQGWTQERIAKAKGVGRTTVTQRIKYNELSLEIKKYVAQNILKEADLKEITQMSLERHFLPWLTTEQAHLELAYKAAKSHLTVRQTKDTVSEYKKFIAMAADLCKKTNRSKEFITLLAGTKARSMSQVQEAYNQIKEAELREAQERELALIEGLDKAEAGRIRLEQETEKNRLVQEILDKIILGDFADIGPTLPAESIDAIITDPPYPKEFLPLYEILAIQAARLLKPGGSLLVMCGQSYIPEILNLMTPYIDYFWMLSYQTPGGQSPQIWPKKVNTFWKPVIWFVKGEYQGDWHGDVIKSDVNDNDKKHHHWGQSESGMRHIIEKFTAPGHTILDPFLGGGTTGLIAISSGCKFVGIDKEKECIETSKERIYTMLRGDNNG